MALYKRSLTYVSCPMWKYGWQNALLWIAFTWVLAGPCVFLLYLPTIYRWIHQLESHNYQLNLTIIYRWKQMNIYHNLGWSPCIMKKYSYYFFMSAIYKWLIIQYCAHKYYRLAANLTAEVNEDICADKFYDKYLASILYTWMLRLKFRLK